MLLFQKQKRHPKERGLWMRKHAYKVSPSMMESVRLYRDEDWFTTERLVRQISEPFKEDEGMRLGTAIHKFIEDGTQSDEFQIHYQSVEDHFVDLDMSLMTHEVKEYGAIETSFGLVQLNSKADGIIGVQGYEWKTTAKSPNLDSYINSIQWKATCYVLGLEQIEYRVMQIAFDINADHWYVKKCEKIPLVFSPSHIEEIRSVADFTIDTYINLGYEDQIKPYYPDKKKEPFS